MRTLLAIATLAAISGALRLQKITDLAEKFDQYDVDGDGLIDVSEASALIDDAIGRVTSHWASMSEGQRRNKIQMKITNRDEPDRDGLVDFDFLVAFLKNLWHVDVPDY